MILVSVSEVGDLLVLNSRGFLTTLTFYTRVMLFFFLVVLQLQHSEVSATRSSNLVQELYIENAKLTKALQQTEANEKRAEKANRQLTEQKRALQRVISKLCGANAIA